MVELVAWVLGVFAVLCVYSAQKHAASCAKQLRQLREHFEQVSPRPAAATKTAGPEQYV